jgi:hypothetical protein
VRPIHGWIPTLKVFAAIAFDVHLAETLVPWKQGVAIATAPRELILNNLAEAVQKLEVTHLGCVPSLIEAAFGGLAEGHGKLKFLTSGGEKITNSVSPTPSVVGNHDMSRVNRSWIRGLACPTVD